MPVHSMAMALSILNDQQDSAGLKTAAFWLAGQVDWWCPCSSESMSLHITNICAAHDGPCLA
jgi:hypothetical protein